MKGKLNSTIKKVQLKLVFSPLDYLLDFIQTSRLAIQCLIQTLS